MAIGASLFDDTDTASVDDVDAAMQLIIGVLKTMSIEEAIHRGTRYQNWLIDLEAELFARNIAAGATDRDNEKLAGEGRKTTKKTAKKRAKRGKAVKENPDLAKDIASGDLGPEQADAIAEAASKTGGDAARDDELIDEIKNSSPDDADKIARRWVNKHNDIDEGDSAEARRRRQRRSREVSRFDAEDGMAALLIKGDDESVDEMYAGLKAAAKKLWKRDGGRDVPASKQPRTRGQRMFDAAYSSLTRPSTSEGHDDSGTGSGSGSVQGHIHMWVQLDDFMAGKNTAEFANGNVVPDTVLSRYACNGTIAATVFGADGEVLYQGRQQRYATPAQIRGLIARDKGCVRCRADISECEAHHLIPWNAPLEGNTNIDELALVCVDCHHFIHDTNQTLFRNAKGLWKLRAATPDEIPPKRPHPDQNPSGSKHRARTHQVRHE